MMAWGLDTSAWMWMSVEILALVAMVWLIVRDDRRAPANDPEAILRDRFALGEITPEEYERTRLVLRHEKGTTR